MKIIGIVGTRKRDTSKDQIAVKKKFLEIYEEGDEIVSGGCPEGGDRFAESIAKSLGIPITIYYPNWKKYGKVAGFIRNTPIAIDATVLIACVASNRKGGTEDTITKFKKHHPKNTIYLV